ncbi:MAG: DUF488 family protein [Thermodesulfobacteriota bacterium]|nr:DUF488 family protein [Thermodesulfobacteriota bacterium]
MTMTPKDYQGDGMSNLNYPKFHRQRFILTLLKQANGYLSKMDFQKLLFLSHRETTASYYDFIPYHYDCYSFQAASDLETLQNLGWLQGHDRGLTLLHKLPVYKGLKVAEVNELTKFMQRYEDYRGQKLVRYVYEGYPYYAVKSKMAQDVLNVEGLERVKKEKESLQSKESVIFTIGYEGLSIEEYINKLLKNDIRLLCDVRKNPISRKYGFSKGSLSNLLPKVGIEYIHIPALGIASINRKHLKTKEDFQCLFNEYNKTISQKKTSLLMVIELLEAHKRIALTCFEKLPSLCHRHCISDYLKAKNVVKIVHL